jgi:hypothetical protein
MRENCNVCKASGILRRNDNPGPWSESRESDGITSIRWRQRVENQRTGNRLGKLF